MKQLRIKYEGTLEQLFNNFLTSRQALGVQEKTIKTYKAHFQAMSHYLDPQELISDFQEEEVEEMIVGMRRKDLSPNSIKSYLITLRAFFRWCKEKGICDITVKPYKGQDILKEPYTNKEIEALLKKPNLQTCGFTYGNVFAVFLDNLEEPEEKPWYKRLYDDEIPAFECDGYELEFDSPKYAKEVYDGYRNRTPITPFDGMNTLTGTKHLIAAKCGDAGVIAGGDQIKIVTKSNSISEEDIEPLSKKWWKYWNTYWRLRGTKDALQKDWACEVTIPVDVRDLQAES